MPAAICPPRLASAVKGVAMAIDGAYGFVYCGANGLGIGIFTVIGEQFEGIDYDGIRYSGTAHENQDSTIQLAIRVPGAPWHWLGARSMAARASLSTSAKSGNCC